MNTSDILGIAGILIGAILSYYFYRISIRAKEPFWTIQSNNLVQNLSAQLSEIEVAYRGKKVENLTVSKLFFWNAGVETIDKSDITTSSPLRITIKDGKILDAQVIYSNNLPSQFQIRVDGDGQNVYLEFDYLDHQNGALIQLIHTGIESEQINVTGAIKGVKTITKFERIYPTRTNKFFKFLPKKNRFCCTDNDPTFISNICSCPVYANINI